MSGAPPALRLFFDTDALLAGAASTRGAAHLLLRLGELGLVDAVTCAYVQGEALRNVAAKLPQAGPLLQALLGQAVTVVPDAPPGSSAEEGSGVHPKDLPVWRAFHLSRAAYLVTFNPDFRKGSARRLGAQGPDPRGDRTRSYAGSFSDSRARLTLRDSG